MNSSKINIMTMHIDFDKVETLSLVPVIVVIISMNCYKLLIIARIHTYIFAYLIHLDRLFSTAILSSPS